MHLGPEELLVAAKIGGRSRPATAEQSRPRSTRPRAVRAAEPTAQVIYLEPDIYRADHVPGRASRARPRPAGH